MLPAYLAARAMNRRSAEESAETARQLPLYAEEIPYWQDPERGDAPRTEPDWTKNY